MSCSFHGFLEAFRQNEHRYVVTRNWSFRLAEFYGATRGMRSYFGKQLGVFNFASQDFAIAPCSLASVLYRSLKTLAALFAVAVQRVENDGIGFARRAYLVDLDGFAFELFVVLKKTAQHEHAMRRHFRSFVGGVELRIFGGDGNDFMIWLAAVDHGHKADGARVNDGERHDWFLAEYEHVERVVIFGQSLRDEAVVRGIVNRGVENAVELDQSTGLVEFVLYTRPKRDLDHAIEFLRELVSGSYVVPGMDHRIFGTTFHSSGGKQLAVLSSRYRFSRTR